jgi:glycosyltransferase involved in cell wall biosynthesis
MHLHHFKDPRSPSSWQQMQPAISLIIPVRNGAATIGKCLEAALASRCAGLEVIVVDDASQDGSAEIVRRYPCALVRLARHSGAAAARNAGARHASGKLLFFTDADCLLLEDTLSVAAQASALEGPEAAIGGTYTWMPYDERFFSIFQSVSICHAETAKRVPDYLATHALVISAEAFRRSGGFREGFLPILEDVEFSHRLRRQGCALAMDPAIRVRHVFNYSFSRSLRNAFVKSMYWTLYSIRNRDLFADSGAASAGLKLDVAAFFLSVSLLLAFLATGHGAWLAAIAAVCALNLYANRGLLRAFRRARGGGFALAAALYYFLVYPVPVGAGAAAGVLRYPATFARRGR